MESETWIWYPEGIGKESVIEEKQKMAEAEEFKRKLPVRINAVWGKCSVLLGDKTFSSAEGIPEEYKDEVIERLLEALDQVCTEKAELIHGEGW